MNNQHEPVDRLARAVHLCLLTGLVISGLLMLAGLLVAMIKHQPRPEALVTKLPDLLHMAAEGNGVAWMELGIFALVLTPVVRVIVLAIGWAVRREQRMALIAMTVFCLLLLSIYLSIG
ncbi:MAG TPA: DUF1634 domain-containing protein [Pirellulales bacterium]|jgi:uncharacterized membrane protein|nr:DUF1634 domain-containing protein [Pirellulales bacterium]